MPHQELLLTIGGIANLETAKLIEHAKLENQSISRLKAF
jgi:hypothetical protein